MKGFYNIKKICFGIIIILSGTCESKAQIAEVMDSLQTEAMPEGEATQNDELLIPPLFEYITAPDDLPDLQSRTDYLMENFWNPFDFKNTKVVDQNALNHAFGVFAQAMPYASAKKVEDSVKKLIGKIKGNPILTYQFTKAAEEYLYSPRAVIWADNLYISFLENLIQNKKIDNSKKNKYAEQLSLLKKTSVGTELPFFNVISFAQDPAGLHVDRPYTLIEFAPEDCEDCRYSNLKLDISGKINDMIEEGILGVQVIILSPENPSDFNGKIFPAKWRAGYSNDAKSQMDIRLYPSFYIIDNNRKIIAKNLYVDDAIDFLNNLTLKQ